MVSVQVEGKEAPGPLFDFGLLMFHCGKILFEHQSGPFFYLSKVIPTYGYGSYGFNAALGLGLNCEAVRDSRKYNFFLSPSWSKKEYRKYPPSICQSVL